MMRAVYLVATLVALAAVLAATHGRVYEEDAEWDPSLMDEREMADFDDDDDIDTDQEDEPIPEAQNYYEVMVDQHANKHGKGKFKEKLKNWYNKHRKTLKKIAIIAGVVLVGKRSVDAQLVESRRASDKNIMGYILGTEAEEEPYRSREAILQLRASKVIQADLYERRLAPGLPKYIVDALEAKQSGVVITLEDGRRFLVVKGNQYGEGKAPALIPANRMAPDWKKIMSREISNSVVSDFIAAVKNGYDVIDNNGNQAADRMMLLS